MALGMAVGVSLERDHSMTVEFPAPVLAAQKRALGAAPVMPDLEPCPKHKLYKEGKGVGQTILSIPIEIQNCSCGRRTIPQNDEVRLRPGHLHSGRKACE
jgi:hypothetical protein